MKSAVSGTPQRAYWLKKLHEWHWISSAICLIGMLLFAITGITLNHAGQIEAKPSVQSREGRLPPNLLQELQALEQQAKSLPAAQAPGLPESVLRHFERELKVGAGARTPEWSDGEVYVAMPRPGGDAWLRVDLSDGGVEYESTDRGWISYFNDLHKGRHTGVAWSWFIDLFAVGCLVFCMTGLLILNMHSERRPLTWPMVGLGLLMPALLALLWIH